MSHEDDKSLYLQAQARAAETVNTSYLKDRLREFVREYIEAIKQTKQSQPQMLLKAVRNSSIWNLFPDTKVPADEVEARALYLTRRVAFNEEITDQINRPYTFSEENLNTHLPHYRRSLDRFQAPEDQGQETFIQNIRRHCQTLSLQGDYEEDTKYNTNDSVADVLEIMEQLETPLPISDQLELYAVSHLHRAAVAFEHQESFTGNQVDFKDNPFYHLQKASELVSCLEQVVGPQIWAQQ
ncbi:hypothetical protein ACFLZ1_03375 [Patescibacteria group bacterium]